MAGLRDDSMTEEGGEGYFASVSDLMVGVLFVFLLMLTVFALNYRDDSATLDALKQQATLAEQRAQASEQRAEQLRAQAALAEQRAQTSADRAGRLLSQNEALRLRLDQAADALARELQDREDQRASLLRRVADRLDAGHVSFTLDEGSGVLHLSDAVPFATGRSDLSDPKARQTTDLLGGVLAETLPCFATGGEGKGCQIGDAPILETVLVEGHTDRQPYPSMTFTQSEQENDRLSAARALTVFTELRQFRPVLDALRNPADQPLLGISGYGQRRPLSATNATVGADAGDRRIDVRFVLASRTSNEVRALLREIEALRQEQVQ